MEAARLRDIPGYETRYAASADGRIWSYGSARWLKPYRVGGNYLAVEIDQKNMKVHRLVALAWIANPLKHPVVNHLDGDKGHNAASNLEWCTISENTKHALRIGLASMPPRDRIAKGGRSGAKLTVEKVAVIKARLARGEEGKALAVEYGVTQPNISAINRGITWRDVAPAELPS